MRWLLPALIGCGPSLVPEAEVFAPGPEGGPEPIAPPACSDQPQGYARMPEALVELHLIAADLDAQIVDLTDLPPGGTIVDTEFYPHEAYAWIEPEAEYIAVDVWVSCFGDPASPVDTVAVEDWSTLGAEWQALD